MIRSGAFLLLAAVIFGLISPANALAVKDSCADAVALKSPINIFSKGYLEQAVPLQADYFLNAGVALGADQIASQEFVSSACSKIFKAPERGGALWLRFEVKNDRNDTQTASVAFMEGIFDDVTLFEHRADGITAVSNGGRGTVDHENGLITAVSFKIKAGDTKLFYMRVSGAYAPNIVPIIISAELLPDWTELFTIMSALLLGFSLLMILSSLILFRHIEARFYQYYTIYIGSLFIFALLYHGWPALLFDVSIPLKQFEPLTELFSGIAVLANIQYCRILLTTNETGNHLGQQSRSHIFTLLTVIGVMVIALAIVDSKGVATPLTLFFFISPLILLLVSIQKIRKGLRQAIPVCASLFCLFVGLSFINYCFFFPFQPRETDSASQLILMHPLTLSYAFAILGEGLFMMVAISIMMNTMQSQRKDAIAAAIRLQSEIRMSELAHRDEQKITGLRIETLNALLADNPERSIPCPAEQSFLDRATKCVIDSIPQKGFGARALAQKLGVTEKTLGRRLQALQPLAPAAFIRSIRLSYARDLILLRQYNTVTEIANASGFSSVSHFTKSYSKEFNETPSEAFRSIKAVS
ncbi:helix-turn-helix domain-containing protein [Parasphingorhabdus cellanae]|uniref:Helix-turn-helix domain-containing protein n=1 Tax=Parasphingorhabdus cellanae TaxID=2806553 RepID=A0ABX7TAJ7_9SPHN|nr:helix-turn-helix domain-containing protein [Parasphingorhabdus cellanae]QTD57462.1 helix-turn-helix domain-containing protein [Parasphingorhabdus cellanae]